MTSEGIGSHEDATEAYRELADKFVKTLGYSSVHYLSASRNSGIVHLKFASSTKEIGEPKSNAIVDVDAFQSEFRASHASAFSILPRQVAVLFELEHAPGAGHGLTLYF